eukprot:8784688-Pyramimonas_sp.AAC.1
MYKGLCRTYWEMYRGSIRPTGKCKGAVEDRLGHEKGSRRPTGTCIGALSDLLGNVWGLCRTYWALYSELHGTYLALYPGLSRTHWDMSRRVYSGTGIGAL